MQRFRHRYPAIPAQNVPFGDDRALHAVLEPVRERLQMYARERGNVEDSMVRVQDLIDLGLITPEQARTLKT